MLSAIKFHDESMSKLYKPNPYKFDLKFLVSNFFYFSYHRFVNAEMMFLTVWFKNTFCFAIFHSKSPASSCVIELL